jgi:hypothetical protein
MILAKALFHGFKILLPALFAWLFSVNTISAQHLGYKRYTVDDGLVQSEVVSIFQDSRGFIWAGTKFGVSRFDGNTFITRFDSLGILKSAVRFIEEFPDGAVFTSSTSGYVIFQPDGQMTAFKYPGLNTESAIFSWTSKGRVYVIFCHQTEIQIIEATLNGPVNVTGSFKKLVSALKPFEIRNFCYDKKYDCFYFTDTNINTYSNFGEKVTKLELPPCMYYTNGHDGYIYMLSTIDEQKDKAPSHSVNTENLPALGYEHGLFKLKGDQTEIVQVMRSSKPSFLKWANVAKTGKIIIPDTDRGSLHYFANGKETVGKLAIDGLASLYTDNEGTIWIGTANGLIHVFPECFVNFSTEEGLYPNTQTIIAAKDDEVWIGSYEGGLQYYKNGRFNTKELGKLTKRNLPFNFYPGGRVDHLGRVHFCVSLYCEFIWDGRNMQANPNWPIGSTFYFYDDTATRKYFFGSDLGLVEQAYGDDKLKSFHVFPGNSNASRIVSIVRTTTGVLLLGGFKGLIVYDGNRFMKLPDSVHPDIPGANAMEKDHRGNIWIGNGNGIYFYDNKTFRKIDNDYFNDLVLSLKWIDSSRLLIGGIRGIGILDLNTFYKTGKASVRFFDKSNGFIGGECQQNCITRDSEGYFWIGATNGIVRIDAAAIPNEIPAPRIYLTQVFTYNQRLDWNPLSISDFGKGEVTLSPKDNNIRFGFTGICFSAPENIKFSYKLEGFDKHWSKPGTERMASYTNLPPGDYTFKVRACTDSGTWSETTAVFRIITTVAFWQRWYFYLFILGLLSIIATFGVSRFLARRTRIIRIQANEKRHLAELQFKTLRNQLAPHFIFNALNAIGASIYQNDKEKAYDFLQRFASLIRSTLTHADKSYRTLKEEIEFVRNYLDLEQFRFQNKFEYNISLQDGISSDILVPKMIIQTFAENAVKHGLIQKSGKGFLSIRLSSELDSLMIIVEDNGIGRVESMKYNTSSTGKGLEIIKEFIALFNRFNEKKIHFDVHDIPGDSGTIAGTCVTIRLPVDFSYNSQSKSF